MINRAIAQHAGRAVGRLADDLGCRREGPRRQRVCRAGDNEGRGWQGAGGWGGARWGGARWTAAGGAKGRVVSGFVGPKITSVGRCRAAAMCAGPVSFVTSRLQWLRTATVSARFVAPVSTMG